MQGTIENLMSREQTAKMIFKSARFYNDLALWLDASLDNFFNFVKKIPYKEDPAPMELVARPKYLLFGRMPGLDCKKKAVLIGAWLNAHAIPWRLLAVSERPDRKIHHVFVQADLGGEWKNIDPTLPTYKLFESKPLVTAGEIITDD